MWKGPFATGSTARSLPSPSRCTPASPACARSRSRPGTPRTIIEAAVFHVGARGCGTACRPAPPLAPPVLAQTPRGLGLQRGRDGRPWASGSGNCSGIGALFATAGTASFQPPPRRHQSAHRKFSRRHLALARLRGEEANRVRAPPCQCSQALAGLSLRLVEHQIGPALTRSKRRHLDRRRVLSVIAWNAALEPTSTICP